MRLEPGLGSTHLEKGVCYIGKRMRVQAPEHMFFLKKEKKPGTTLVTLELGLQRQGGPWGSLHRWSSQISSKSTTHPVSKMKGLEDQCPRWFSHTCRNN